MPGGIRRLRAGDLVVLPPQQRHALRPRMDSAVLCTLLLRDGDAGGGGTGARTLQQDADNALAAARCWST